MLAMPNFLVATDLTVLNLAGDSIQKTLNPSPSQALWIIDIYGFMVAGFLIPMGAVGDNFGRRRILLIGSFLFLLASVWAVFAETANMLIAARAMQGLGGAVLAPSTLALIKNLFDREQDITKAVAIWMAGFTIGGATGPFLGGYLLEYYWWGSVFIPNIPIMIIILLGIPLIIREKHVKIDQKFDFLSVIISLIGILSFIYGVKKIAEEGAQWLYVGYSLLGVVVFALFIYRQYAIPNPMINIALFRHRAFVMAVCLNFIMTFVIFGMYFLSLQLMITQLGFRPLDVVIFSTGNGIATIIGALTSPIILNKFKPNSIIFCGFTCMAIGYILFAQIDTPDDYWYFIIGSVVEYGSLPFMFGITVNTAVQAAPPENTAIASAMAETSTELGGASGLALLGSLYFALNRLGGNPIGHFQTISYIMVAFLGVIALIIGMNILKNKKNIVL